MKPGHKAPAPTGDVAALALAAAFTVLAAAAFYGVRGARSLSRRLASAPAAPAPSAVLSAQSSPLPYPGEELRARQPPPELARRETPTPAAGYPPLDKAMGQDDGLASPGAPPHGDRQAFEPPHLQPFQDPAGDLGGDGAQTQAFLAATAGPTPPEAGKGPQAPVTAPLPGMRGVSPAAVKRGAGKSRARASGPQGGTSAISFGTP